MAIISTTVPMTLEVVVSDMRLLYDGASNTYILESMDLALFIEESTVDRVINRFMEEVSALMIAHAGLKHNFTGIRNNIFFDVTPGESSTNINVGDAEWNWKK